MESKSKTSVGILRAGGAVGQPIEVVGWKLGAEERSATAGEGKVKRGSPVVRVARVVRSTATPEATPGAIVVEPSMRGCGRAGAW